MSNATNEKKPVEIVANGEIDPVNLLYRLTVYGIPTEEMLREYAIKMSAHSGAVLAEVMGGPARAEFAGGMAPAVSRAGAPTVERVSQPQVEEMIRMKMAENATCPCPNCVARRERENKNRPDPNVRH
jgi:hypothetical protein